MDHFVAQVLKGRHEGGILRSQSPRGIPILMFSENTQDFHSAALKSDNICLGAKAHIHITKEFSISVFAQNIDHLFGCYPT